MSREMLSTVHASHSTNKESKLSPKTKARALHAWEWGNHVQTALAVVGGGLALASGGIGAAALAGGYVAWNEGIENRVIRNKRLKLEREAGMPPRPARKKLFRRSNQVHHDAAPVAPMAEVHQLPQHDTIYQAPPESIAA